MHTFSHADRIDVISVISKKYIYRYCFTNSVFRMQVHQEVKSLQFLLCFFLPVWDFPHLFYNLKSEVSIRWRAATIMFIIDQPAEKCSFYQLAQRHESQNFQTLPQLRPSPIHPGINDRHPKCFQILIMLSFVVLLKEKLMAVIKVLCAQTIKYGLYACVCVCLHLLHIRDQKTHSMSKLRLGDVGLFLWPHNFKGRLKMLLRIC